jgi:uncharacterized protein (TIGR03435 family)
MRSFIAVTALALAGLARGQTTTPLDKYVFEAASIKPAPPDDGRNMAHVSGGPGTSDPSQFTAKNITLGWLLSTAFPESYRIIGPDWLDETHYDVITKVPPGTTRDQFKLMVRNLLEERADLKAHQETREYPAFDLVVAKGGPKMAEANEEPQTPTNQSGGQQLDADGFPQLDKPGLVVQNTFSHGLPMSRMIAKGQTMSSFTRWLHGATRAYVNDKTGLTGKYDFKLEYTFESAPSVAPVSDSTVETPSPTRDIFSAIKNLGLALEKSKASLEVTVIDHIERALRAN